MKIRLWKLGSLEHKIYPSQSALVKLSNVLEHINDYSDEFGVADIVWGPDITVQEIKIEDAVGFVSANDEELTEKIKTLVKEHVNDKNKSVVGVR